MLPAPVRVIPVEERLERLLALDPDQLEALAVDGTIGPEIARGPEDVLVARVASGLKPSAIDIAAAGARQARALGLVVRALGSYLPDEELECFDAWPDAEGEFSPDAVHLGGLELYFAVAATVEAMDELERAWLLNGVTRDGDDWSGARLGLALGYSDADVAAFVVSGRRARLAAPTAAQLDRLWEAAAARANPRDRPALGQLVVWP